ncbi:phosphate signaling complex protein PhoU [Candidatus Formimonas warabiya]|uniref:Phosphate-specific transport system accessory protein PhoU n=1 Tax=Formimonas warabiya TaxID=1761012 RepID=A0A3G1KN31_FORW1|nr:phosphate signaling complex protein PhoU [Candidatus Formimonas warabiya]ATW23873.1 phosphate transport system regulatory protein PhoU [Candidatus Formimonas warabiya]
MTRETFQAQLKDLQQQILRMGSLVEEAIANSVAALKLQDTVLAQKIIDEDDIIDDFYAKIEDQCLKLIATQQPMAKDLRKIITGLKIIGDLERMADHAVDISKIALQISHEPLIKPLIDIPRMSEYAQKMVKHCLDAYVKEDTNLANSVGLDDDLVDHLHRQIFRELLTYMMEDPRTIKQATHLLFVSRYLERIADRATNIGEAVIYLVTGDRTDINN